MTCYLTTAIDYANGKPHLGHAYEKVLADVLSRLYQLQGQKVHFVTGLDEHGQKVQQSAQAAGIAPQTLCDNMAAAFQALCQRLGVQYHDYIRTTESRHRQVVQHTLQTLWDQGLIYKAEYQGFYSQRAEQFLQDKDRLPDGSWPEIYGPVHSVTESNYFFRLSLYQDWLREYIQTHPDFIVPAFRAKQVLEFLKDPINDLCISRPIERLSWGIPLPFDPAYVTYVWFDALLNYISAVGYGTAAFAQQWPARFHIIGKDILVPAHAVYWPIMLKALGLELPRSLLVHGWWLCKGEKMSKSQGNVIDPLTYIDSYGPDSFRYFLMREMRVGYDSDFSHERFMARYQDDLGNDLGNLVSRTLHMCQRYTQAKVPQASAQTGPHEVQLIERWHSTQTGYHQACQDLQLHSALEHTFDFLKALNQYADLTAPWKQAQQPDGQAALHTSLASLIEGLRLAATLLLPFMPQVAARILQLLGVSAPVASFEGQLAWDYRLQGACVGPKTILFPRDPAAGGAPGSLS